MTACCHGFFVPTSVVDFQKGERYVAYTDRLKGVSHNLISLLDRSIWIIASAKLYLTT